jgi:hypothetical protein
MTTLVVIVAAALVGFTAGRMSHPRAATTIPVCLSISAAPPVLSAPPVGPAEVAEGPRLPAVTDRSADDLVHVAVGRWVGEDGTIVEIDPPKPAPGRAPPYRLVIRGVSLPRSGYGCEFALGETKRGPGETLYYRAWCGRGMKATVGLSLDDKALAVVVLQDGDVKVHAEKLGRVSP